IDVELRVRSQLPLNRETPLLDVRIKSLSWLGPQEAELASCRGRRGRRLRGGRLGKIGVDPIGRLWRVPRAARARIAEPGRLFLHFGLIIEETRAGPDDRLVVVKRAERDSEPRCEDVLGHGAISAAAGIGKHVTLEILIKDRLVRSDDSATTGL